MRSVKQCILYSVAALLAIGAVAIVLTSIVNNSPSEDLVLNQMRIVLPEDAVAVEQTDAEELKNI